MKYLLDTDHLSIIQRASGRDYTNLANRMARLNPSDFAVSIVTFHEQVLGGNAYIARARTSSEVVKGYEMMARIRRDFNSMPVLPFDQAAATVFDDLQSKRVRLGTMDLRIASIAVSRQLVLLTRNNQDFGRLPGLLLEDWTSETSGEV